MEILAPMLGMITLTGLMVVVLYATRAPLIIKFWGNAQGARHSEDLRPQLPDRLRYVTDNYNHLFEQPVLFYAVVVYIFFLTTQTVLRPVGLGIRWLASDPLDHPSHQQQRFLASDGLWIIESMPGCNDYSRAIGSILERFC